MKTLKKPQLIPLRKKEKGSWRHFAVEVRVQDYHEFRLIQNNYRFLDRAAKVKEIGFDGEYVGIAYNVTQKHPRYLKVRNAILKSIEEYRERMGLQGF